MTNEFIYDLPEHEYLSDRSRTSGSCLSMVARDPREYGRYLAGKREDSPSDAMRLGKYVHAVLLEGRSVVPERFAFAPSRAEYMVPKMVEVTGPRGGKKLVPCPTGAVVPQDPEQPNKLMELRTDEAKAYYRRFTQDNAGRTIIHPDQQPLAEAMIRAVLSHREAFDLLHEGFRPEVTAHWTDEQTGELMRARFDGYRPRERQIIELKTVARLDPSNNGQLTDWLRDGGWARKAALYLDAAHTITGINHVMVWVIVEAVEEDPGVALMYTACDSTMADLGRVGSEDWSIPGYIELIQLAQQHRETKDFRRWWERGAVEFPLPPSLKRSMEYEHEQKAPPIKGARKMEALHG